MDTYHDRYMAGWDAFHEGASYDDNPFEGFEGADWEDGYNDAKAGRDPEV